jgi:hypothetical protein
MSSALVLSIRPNYWKISLICNVKVKLKKDSLTVRIVMKPFLVFPGES